MLVDKYFVSHNSAPLWSPWLWMWLWMYLPQRGNEVLSEQLQHLAATSIYEREEKVGRNLVLSTFMKEDIDRDVMKIDTISPADAHSSKQIPMEIT